MKGARKLPQLTLVICKFFSQMCMQKNNEALHVKLESSKKELQEGNARELQKLQENSDQL
jgi:hypothetical protein